MSRRLRYLPCNVPGCPSLAVRQGRCDHHAPPAWEGRNGTTRRAALGVSDGTWHKLRRAALRRDRERCRRCSAPAAQVDHLVPIAWRLPPTGWSLHLAGLMSLCRECHAVKSQREAALGRAYGSPPPAHVIDNHVQGWLWEVGHAAV